MFCGNCGFKINSNDKFCRNCGEKVTIKEVDYNAESIVDEFGKDRIGACKYLSNMYGIPLSKAKKIIDDEHNKRNKAETMNAKQKLAEKHLKEQQEKNKVNELKKDKIPFCPKCHSTSLTAQKKGFGLLKGAIGVATLGAYGVTAAGIGKNKIILTCLNCGYQFKPGK